MKEPYVKKLNEIKRLAELAKMNITESKTKGLPNVISNKAAMEGNNNGHFNQEIYFIRNFQTWISSTQETEETFIW